MAASENFYRFVVDSVPEAIITVLEDGKIVSFNPAAERLLGYSAADAQGQDITLLVPVRDDRRASPLKWLERWAADPGDTEPRFLDLMATTKTGTEVPLGVRVRKAQFEGRAHFVITLRDTSELRSRQASQRDAALRATRILQIAEDAIITINNDQNIIFANLKAEEMFGYTSAEFSGKALIDLLPKEARQNHGALVKAFGNSHAPSKRMRGRSEISGQRKDGDIFPLEASITNVTTGGVTTYTAHLRDVTIRKAADRALVESELRARAIFDNAMQAMALLDPNGNVLEINKAGVALTTGGKVSGKMTGVALWELPWIFEDEASRQDRQDQLKTSVDKGAAGEATRFVGNLTVGGKPKQIDFDLIPVADEDGKVVFLIAEGRDITEAARHTPGTKL